MLSYMVRRLPIWSPSTYPWILPSRTANQAISGHHSHILSKFSCPYPYISPLAPLAPPHCYRPANTVTPNHHWSTPSIHSRYPNHLNLSCLTASATLWIPKRLCKSLLRFLSFKDILHFYLTIIRSTLIRLQIFSFHRPCFSPICQHTQHNTTQHWLSRLSISFFLLIYLSDFIYFSNYKCMQAHRQESEGPVLLRRVGLFNYLKGGNLSSSLIFI